MSDISENLLAVRGRIGEAARRAGREPEAVKLVAVTKRVAAERIREAAAAGVTAVGENYVQEAITKRETLKDLGLEWHLIGHLQTNKAKAARRLFDVVETVDRADIARALVKYSAPEEAPLPVLIQVFLGGVEGRAGIPPAGLPQLLEELSNLQGLRLRGLMGVAPPGEVGESRRAFATLRVLWEDCSEWLAGAAGVQWDTLSMGMSGDFEVAIEEGATLVRLGNTIFGARA